MRSSPCLALLSLIFVPACASDVPERENTVDSANSDAGGTAPGGATSGNGSGGSSGHASGGAMGAPDAGRADAGSNGRDDDAEIPVIDKGDDDRTPGNDADGKVSCGPKSPSCDLESQACCVTGFGAANTSCQDGTTCAKGNPTPCDGPEECGAGESCCVSPAQGTTVCKVGCGAGFASFEITLCHVDNDCPAGKSCSESGTLPWWGTCN